MKKLLKLFTYIFVFVAFFIIFLPKESFYNLLEKELEKNLIIVSNETKDEKLFSFSILNGEIIYEGINVGTINEASFTTYLFYSELKLNSIVLLDSLSSFVPTPIEEIVFSHSILDFNKIKIKANGAFGELNGDINIFSRIIKVELNASNKMKTSYSKLLKDMKFENGRYIYEYKF